jgi:myo-inositol-1(or 4)-monophosphatase
MRDRSDFQSVAEAAVREAGAFLRKNLDSRPEASFKGAVDLVTECDLAAQGMLADRLTAAFPDHGILAEEGLARPGRSAYRWVVDPLDGTTNFAHTFPVFSVSAALEERGRTILGLVFDPMRDEMFTAREGAGSFLNGRPIRVSKVAELGRSLLATGFPYDVRTSSVNNVDHWTRFLLRAQAVRRCGSAAMDLCYVACGRFDGFWELKLKPWDVAAGVLIIREAGGRVTALDGGAHCLETPDTLASNGLIHQAMIDVLGVEPARTGRERVDG